MICILTNCYSVDQIKDNETGGACGTHEGEKMLIQGFL